MPERKELKSAIIQLIKEQGPIDVSTYMSLALFAGPKGYYASGNPLGPQGDFVTAPELSQIFGELIGIWLVQTWIDLGEPPTFSLVELGPGSGTMMADILRATKNLVRFQEALSLHLVEKNESLRAVQAQQLRKKRPVHYNDLEELWSFLPQNGPVLMIANEFFDCLPIKQFANLDGLWQERMVGLDHEDQLAFCWMQRGTEIPLPENRRFVEVSPVREAAMIRLAHMLQERGGAALLIDYGADGLDDADTLQAVRRHQKSEPLADPGSVDISSHVDFQSLAHLALDHGLNVFGPLTQKEFLLRMGFRERLTALIKSACVTQKDAVYLNALRLIDERDGMGALFKVMSLTGGLAAICAFNQEERYERH